MYYIGVDVGGMSIKIGIVDGDGNIVKTLTFTTSKDDSQEVHAILIGENVNKLIEESNISKSEIKGVGIGVPGGVKPSEGLATYVPNIPWVDLPLAKIVEGVTGLPVKLGNDADVATLGEVYFGVAKNYSNVVLITIGTGVGGGIVLDKKLYQGNLGMVAELGHVTLKLGGHKCGCGRRGCLEQYASATALIRLTKEKMLENRDSAMWDFVDGDIEKVNGITSFACAKKGDKVANDVVDEFVSYIGDGLMNFMNIFRPEAVIIGGGISKEGDYLIDKVKAYCDKFSYGYPSAPKADVLAAKLGNNAGIVGAASLFAQE